MIYAITHNDLDGIGCAILMEKVFPEIQTFSIDYKELDEVLPKVLAMSKGDTVYITDISMNEEQAALCNKHGKVQHVDHHSSNKKVSDKYGWSFTDVSHCATYHLFKMLSTYAHLEDYELFVNLVDNYDTWGHGSQPSPLAKDLNRLLQMLGPTAFVLRFKRSPSIQFTDTEHAIITVDVYREEQYLIDSVNYAQAMRDPEGNVFLMIAAEQYTSSLGNYLLEQTPDAEYVLIMDMLHDKASLRSRGKVDVGEMAKACGGGGHKKAAGFQLNDAAVNAFWRCDSCEWRRSGNPDLDRTVSGNDEVATSTSEQS